MTISALPRVLGIRDLIVLSSASIGPAFSLATTFGPMVAAAGYRTPMALVMVTGIMACVALAYRRMGERFPHAGSSYTWIRSAFGSAAGAYGAWVLIVGNIFAVLVTALPAGTYTLRLVAPALAASQGATAIVAAGWIAAACGLLAVGLRPTATVTVTLLVIELSVLGATAVGAFAHAPLIDVAAPSVGVAGVVGAIVIGIWMTDGWEVAASTAEESRGSAWQTGTGGLVGLLLAAAFLLLCTFAFLRVAAPSGFATHQADAMAYVGERLGTNWSFAIVVTVLLSLAASLQTTMVYLSRSLYAMGRDGLLPAVLGRLDARGEPLAAIALVGVVGLTLIAATSLSPSVNDAFATVLAGTSTYLGVLFMLSAASCVRIFAREPFGRITGVVLPSFAAAALAAVLAVSIATAAAKTQVFIGGAALAGIPLALWRGRVAARRM